MAVSSGLTAALKKVVLDLEDDLRERVESHDPVVQEPGVRDVWIREHHEAVTRERTAMSWQEWRDDRLTQAAVAWVLTTVFVRFCEDNRLLKPVWIAGPADWRQEALDAELAYFRAHPEHTDREWLRQAVEYLQATKATKDLVESHSPLWTVSPSGKAAKRLIAFWRERSADGNLVWDLSDPELSTRFLGDLYQDLSDYAQKTYALLQTPEFVEEFILDQTMEPALAERPLEGFKLIDPTCGSGHFLLGAFSRLNDRWALKAPGLEVQARVQKALDAIFGVDLNPFAVAIARFRLTVEALRTCSLTSMEMAPGWSMQLAAGDSLLHGAAQSSIDDHGVDSGITTFVYSTEDLRALARILAPGQYDVVVGNPPYILAKDPAARSAYKAIYPSCYKQWTLVVPFMERFFDLATRGNMEHPAGWVGKITANSFMRRDFGKPLIEKFLSKKDLRLVADISGMQIPGHETPTVIVVGKNQRPESGNLRAVMRIGRERRDTVAPGQGWLAMQAGLASVGWEDEWIAIVDLNRQDLSTHPWSLNGGTEARLKAKLDSVADSTIDGSARRIGFYGDTHADDAYLFPSHFLGRLKLEAPLQRPFIRGEALRDWVADPGEAAFVPYASGRVVDPSDLPIPAIKYWWPYRTALWARAAFSGGTYRTAGLPWLAWHQLPSDVGCATETLAFAFKASHLHVVFDVSGTAFNSTSPVIKFSDAVTPEHIQGLAGILGCSTSSFWARQVAQHQGGGAAEDAWSWTFEFSARIVGAIPTPRDLPVEIALSIVSRVNRVTEILRTVADESIGLSVDDFRNAQQELRRTFEHLVFLQEELDWKVYASFDLIDDSYCYGDELSGIRPGQRAYEISLARQSPMPSTIVSWFRKHESPQTPIIPEEWPASYQKLVDRRLACLESNPSIRVLERPEFKRRWENPEWGSQLTSMIRMRLLTSLEDSKYWFDRHGRPASSSVGNLADFVSRDADLVALLELWSGRKDWSVKQQLAALLDDESVPFLAAYRLKDSGLRKREVWEQTWELQRREDRGEGVGTIPVPPKYTSADFLKPSWWRHRGKLDVPKERFILYPDASRETDSTQLLGWAGWNHAEQALALAAVIAEREGEGWADERLVPLVAGLAELQPWVRQWHDETDPTYQLNLADFLDEQLRGRALQVGLTVAQLGAWRPAPAGRGRRPRV